MQLIAAPARQFKTFSFWLIVSIFVLNSAGVLVNTLNEQKVFEPATFAIVNAVLAFFTGVARFVQQHIALTTEQKIALMQSVAQSPVKEGEPEVNAIIEVST